MKSMLSRNILFFPFLKKIFLFYLMPSFSALQTVLVMWGWSVDRAQFMGLIWYAGLGLNLTWGPSGVWPQPHVVDQASVPCTISRSWPWPPYAELGHRLDRAYGSRPAYRAMSCGLQDFGSREQWQFWLPLIPYHQVSGPKPDGLALWTEPDSQVRGEVPLV